MEHAAFSAETLSDIEELLRISYKESSGPCGDIQQSFIEDSNLMTIATAKSKKLKKAKDGPKKARRE